MGLVFTFGKEEGFANSDDVKGINEWDPADATHVLVMVGEEETE